MDYNSEALYHYVNGLLSRFEAEVHTAERMADSARENLRDIKWLKAELFDLWEKEENGEFDSITPCFVYYITNAEMSMVKIGITNNVKNRISSMQTSTGYYLKLAKAIEFDSREEAFEAERFLHKEFGYCRRKPHEIHTTSEWFDIKILDKLLSQYDSKEKIQAAIKKQRNEMKEAMENVEIKIS